jgi:hypothetical protein
VLRSLEVPIIPFDTKHLLSTGSVQRSFENGSSLRLVLMPIFDELFELGRLDFGKIIGFSWI